MMYRRMICTFSVFRSFFYSLVMIFEAEKKKAAKNVVKSGKVTSTKISQERDMMMIRIYILHI